MPASRRGVTRYFTGLVDRVASASIWSVTRMVPSSAAIAAPTRPATIRPASTGPSSRTTESTTMEDTALSALKRENPVKDCSAITMPENTAVNATTGRLKKANSTNARTNMRPYSGGRSRWDRPPAPNSATRPADTQTASRPRPSKARKSRMITGRCAGSDGQAR